MDYIAIDFETASSNLTSACSIGIVGVEKGKIVLNKHYLINPKQEFNPYNINIHNIYPEDVINSPTFDKVWDEIKCYFDGVVIAHGATFDLAVLKALIEKYDLEVPNIKIGCTLMVAKKIWKEVLPNCKLNTISNYLEIEHNHHNALSDAYVCVKIIERALKCTNSLTIEEVFESLGIVFGLLNEKKFFFPRGKYLTKNTDAVENVFKNKVVAYGGKPLSMSKRKVLEVLEIKGALVSRNIDRSLDYFIVFSSCPKGKLKTLEEVRKKCEIIVLTEEDFLRVVK